MNLGGNGRKRKHFFVSFTPVARHNRRVTITIGAFLNALGILLGGLFGLLRRRPLSTRAQIFFRNAIGAAAVFFALRLVWLSVNGTVLSCLKQLGLALLAVLLGNLLGRWFRLQKLSNRLGRHATRLLSSAETNSPHKTADGFSACTILFWAAPLGLLGAVTDGLSGYFYLLAVKAVMDGLAMTTFVKAFRWPVALSAIPVLILLGAVTLACRFYARPFLEERQLLDSVNAAAGLAACAVAPVIFEIRKVELANLLPALIVAPVLAWLLG
ncbi:MAG TPA: DUF554 family protein [Verrucomicrobiae bacterium]|nr:DUF554 family protein [Verrucomicrobiae bacterium]